MNGFLMGDCSPKEWPLLDNIHPRVASQRSDDLIFVFLQEYPEILSVSSQGVCRKFKENRSVLVWVLCGGALESLCAIN